MKKTKKVNSKTRKPSPVQKNHSLRLYESADVDRKKNLPSIKEKILEVHIGNKETGEHERHYYEAYLGLKSAAEALASVSQFHDAYLSLNFSIECFFKYVFCVVRAEIIKNNPLADFEKSIPSFYKRIFTRRQENLKAESFGHDLYLMLEHLRENTTLKGKPDFEALRKEVSHDRNIWVSFRYQVRSNGPAKKAYLQRDKLFQGVLNESLERLK